MERSGPRAVGALDARGPLWQTIDGGLTGDNIVTGPQQIQFLQPVAVAARGHLVYILDVGHRQLFRYDARTDRIERALDLRGVVSGNDADLYLARDLSVFIADTDGARVLHFDRNGRQVRVIEDRLNITRPVSVRVNDTTGYIFIADGNNDGVLVYNPAGLLESAFGGRGRGPGKFTGISVLAQGPKGYYIGTRFGEHRVQVMGFDGGWLESFQRDTVTFPIAIAVAANGLAFVADYMADDIKVFDGDLLVDVIGGHGAAPGRFSRITSLWIDDGFLYVADSLNRRIQVLSLASWEMSPPKEP
jgi:DNA-binding beta-propeller fold protein YncE